MRRGAALLLAFPLLLGAPAHAEGPEPEYGFRSFEIYKLERGVFGLLALDADRDGLGDLLVVNNAKARLDLFLRRREPVAPKSLEGARKANELGDDRWFERKEILTEKQVSSVAASDFSGDGRTDVAFFGKPEALVVLQGDGHGAFAPLRTFDVEEGVQSQSGLAAGDLNGDGRADLALLTKTHTAVFLQDAGTLKEPLLLPNAAREIVGIAIRDLDGDGRGDLLSFAPSDERSIRVRFQEAGGLLGPEIALLTAPWRGLSIDDVDPRPGHELLVVQRTSGLLRALGLAVKPAGEGTGVPLGTIRIHPFAEAKGGKERAMAVADLDADGRRDVVVTEPSTAQVALNLQDATGRLGARRLFPSLANAESVRVADLGGDARPEIIVLSSGEKAVGYSALDGEGRLPFPATVAVAGTPRAMDAGDVNGDGKADLVVVGERDKARIVFVLLQKEGGGLGEASETPLDMKDMPEDVMLLDLDRDGRNDLLFFTQYGPMRVWRGKEGGGFEPVRDDAAYRGGLVEKIRPGSVNAGDLDGDGRPELLVASQNFARAIRLEPPGGLVVKDQANGRSPRSQINGVATLDLDGDLREEVLLSDAEGGVVTVLARGAAGVFEVKASFPIGRLTFQRLFAEDLNGDGRKDVVVQGREGFGVLYAGAEDRDLVELHAYESPVRDARLDNVASGDLNADGRADLAITDSGNNEIEIVRYDGKEGMREVCRWRVFEEKRHDGREVGNRGEPREITVADLDGDGRNDLAMLVHDRLIVYLQE